MTYQYMKNIIVALLLLTTEVQGEHECNNANVAQVTRTVGPFQQQKDNAQLDIEASEQKSAQALIDITASRQAFKDADTELQICEGRLLSATTSSGVFDKQYSDKFNEIKDCDTTSAKSGCTKEDKEALAKELETIGNLMIAEGEKHGSLASECDELHGKKNALQAALDYDENEYEYNAPIIEKTLRDAKDRLKLAQTSLDNSGGGLESAQQQCKIDSYVPDREWNDVLQSAINMCKQNVGCTSADVNNILFPPDPADPADPDDEPIPIKPLYTQGLCPYPIQEECWTETFGTDGFLDFLDIFMILPGLIWCGENDDLYDVEFCNAKPGTMMIEYFMQNLNGYEPQT